MKRTQLNRKTSLQSGSKSLKRTPLARGDSQLKRKPLKQKVTRLPGSQEQKDRWFRKPNGVVCAVCGARADDPPRAVAGLAGGIADVGSRQSPLAVPALP
jgi:hypothetical protein